MIDSLPPAAILVIGSLLVPLFRGKLQSAYLLSLPLLSGVHLLYLFSLDAGAYQQIQIFDYTLTLARVDKLALVFGLVFHIAALLNVVYALHVKDPVQHVSGVMYAGAAIGAVFAGDLITLFVYWELTALSSVFLIWTQRTERAYRVGMRYLIIQVGSGVILLAGILVHLADGGTLEFGHIGIDGLGGKLILLAFGIKCAFPLLHNWVQDAYPEATITGMMFLSVFTTKLAVYALARGFAGTEALIWIGATMTVFPLVFAAVENDLRRLLAYILNNQLGFMVVGIGIGTELSLNGTAAHAFCHILYEPLLFMAVGAVLYRTGSAKISELGGLARSMPWTTAMCVVGALSISSFPLFNGFVSKSMVVSATQYEHLTVPWFMLLFASAGVFLVCGIKIPYFTFFARGQARTSKEAPGNMLLAMAATAILCIVIGVFPGLLYDILPFAVDYQPYTTGHIVTQMQTLLWTAGAFVLLVRFGLFPRAVPSINLDTDWIYRRLIPAGIGMFMRTWRAARETIVARVLALLRGGHATVYRYAGPEGMFARTWTTGNAVMWVAVMLAVFLLLYYA